MDNFFKQHQAPECLKLHEQLVRNFINHHQANQPCRIALVTSAGPIAPVEKPTGNAVDFISNGTRGATSVEHFIQEGYAVIFLHRRNSAMPYGLKFSSPTILLDCFESMEGTPLRPEYENEFYPALDGDHSTKDKQLLCLPFGTFSDYLFQLRAVTTLMKPLGASALVYLAAVASDRYLPDSEMPEHKIHSSVPGVEAKNESSQAVSTHPGNLGLKTKPTPDFLKALVDQWVREAMVVSFTLDADMNRLFGKTFSSLKHHVRHVVICILLDDPHSRTYVVHQGTFESLFLLTDIEKYTVDTVVLKHKHMISSD